MVKLIANRSMRYGTRSLTAGDVFDASLKDARLLIAVRRADAYVEPPAFAVEVNVDAATDAVDVTVVTDSKPVVARKPRAKKG